MRRDRVRRLLAAVAEGEISAEAALEHLSWLPFETVDAPDVADQSPAADRPTNPEEGEGPGSPFGRIDHHRALRQGFPEVVFAPGKSAAQLVELCRRTADRGDGFLVTRAESVQVEALRQAFETPELEVNATARTVHLPPEKPVVLPGAASVLVVSGGTGDLPVAEEAAVTARIMGNSVERLYDVGVAGIHRLLHHSVELRSAGVLIVVAGMEGALPSVVGGLVATPVVAVPTSVGYGVSTGGFAALVGMLSSCAAGVTVVNIDNGFSAGVFAARVARRVSR